MEIFIVLVVFTIILGIYLFSRRKKEVIVEEHILSDEERLNINKANDFEMVIEDVFVIVGKGTVVTGKIESGLISINEVVGLYGNSGLKRKVTVIGVEMFRKKIEYAQANDQVGILLSDIFKNEIERGDTLTLIKLAGLNSEGEWQENFAGEDFFGGKFYEITLKKQ